MPGRSDESPAKLSKHDDLVGEPPSETKKKPWDKAIKIDEAKSMAKSKLNDIQADLETSVAKALLEIGRYDSLPEDKRSDITVMTPLKERHEYTALLLKLGDSSDDAQAVKTFADNMTTSAPFDDFEKVQTVVAARTAIDSKFDQCEDEASLKTCIAEWNHLKDLLKLVSTSLLRTADRLKTVINSLEKKAEKAKADADKKAAKDLDADRKKLEKDKKATAAVQRRSAFFTEDLNQFAFAKMELKAQDAFPMNDVPLAPYMAVAEDLMQFFDGDRMKPSVDAFRDQFRRQTPLRGVAAITNVDCAQAARDKFLQLAPSSAEAPLFPRDGIPDLVAVKPKYECIGPEKAQLCTLRVCLENSVVLVVIRFDAVYEYVHQASGSADVPTLKSIVHLLMQLDKSGLHKLADDIGKDACFTCTLSKGFLAYIPMGYLVVEMASEVALMARTVCSVKSPIYAAAFGKLNEVLQQLPQLPNDKKTAFAQLAADLCKGVAAALADGDVELPQSVAIVGGSETPPVAVPTGSATPKAAEVPTIPQANADGSMTQYESSAEVAGASVEAEGSSDQMAKRRRMIAKGASSSDLKPV